MKTYVYDHDRSETYIHPLVKALSVVNGLTDDWRAANVVVIASDRREAIRFALDVYERGIPIVQWGAWDRCAGDHMHYDGIYRTMMTTLAHRAYSMRPMTHNDGRLMHISLGPPHVDDLPDTTERPWATTYRLLCMNPLPWDVEVVPEAPDDYPGSCFAMWPGSDFRQRDLVEQLEAKGWTMLTRLPRAEWLRWVRHADLVLGNSSLLTYEAPIWHPDAEIVHVGKRNLGRGTVRWDVAKWGSPTANMMKALQEFAK
jgi:hypothetical protein